MFLGGEANILQHSFTMVDVSYNILKVKFQYCCPACRMLIKV